MSKSSVSRRVTRLKTKAHPPIKSQQDCKKEITKVVKILRIGEGEGEGCDATCQQFDID